MNWKPSLIAAVVVVALGLGAGIAIGGKTETVAGPTRTVVQTVTAPADARPQEGPADTEPGGAIESEGTETDEDPEFLTEDSINIGDNVELLETGTNASLQRGPELSDSVTLSLATDYDGSVPDYYAAELTVPEGKASFKASVGFAKGSPSGNSVKVEFRKDGLRGEVLKQVRLSATEVAEVDVPVDDAALVVVKMSPIEETWNDDDDNQSPRFVFGEARFV